MISLENVKILCKDYTKIENYDKAMADTTQTWHCHHRLQTHNSDGERRLVNISASELTALDMYYNRPSDELIFLTHNEHNVLHHKGNKYNKGKHLSEETKSKISASSKGKKISDEAKAKMSASQKGHNVSDETRAKIAAANKGNQSAKGKHWKLSEETKAKFSAERKGRHWKLIDGHRVYY